jgi:HPt (histidine-containing phosphotransfer) domain-containing protein
MLKPPPDSPPALDVARVDQLEATLGRANRDRLLALVVEHAPRAGDAIARALAEGRADEARCEAHGLRGAIGAVGALPLTAILHAIEQGSPDAAKAGGLAREVARLVDAAHALIAVPGPPGFDALRGR